MNDMTWTVRATRGGCACAQGGAMRLYKSRTPRRFQRGLGLVLMLGFFVSTALAVTDATVMSRRDLRAKGVRVHKSQYDTPMASEAIETLIQMPSELGDYIRTECIVLKTAPVDGEWVQIDARAPSDPVFERRVQSTSEKSTFLVRGAEIPRTYLVFEYKDAAAPDGHRHRYLLPLKPKRTDTAHAAPRRDGASTAQVPRAVLAPSRRGGTPTETGA